MINPSWLELAWTQHPFSGFTETKRGACRYGGYVVYVQRESRAPTFANLALVQVDIPFVCLPRGLGGVKPAPFWDGTSGTSGTSPSLIGLGAGNEAITFALWQQAEETDMTSSKPSVWKTSKSPVKSPFRDLLCYK